MSIHCRSRPGSNVTRLIGHSNLNYTGNDGAGLAMHPYPDCRRIVFFVRDAASVCGSLIDVT